MNVCLRALARGDGPSAIARRFEVSRFWVYQVRDREQETGERSSFQIGGHRRSRLAEAEPALRGWIAAEPGSDLGGVAERLAQQGIVGQSRRSLAPTEQWKLTFKKNSARQRARARGRAGGAAHMERERSRTWTSKSWYL